MKLYTTRAPEAAARYLASRHKRVAVNINYLHRPTIYFRSNMLADLQVYDSRADTAIERWQEQGGIITLPWRTSTPLAELHEASVIVDCPRSMPKIYALAAYTTDTVVVALPPSWDRHREKLEGEAPTPAYFGQLIVTLRRLDNAESPQLHQVVARAVGMPGALVTKDFPLPRGVARQLFHGADKEVALVQLRVRPEVPAAAAAWDMIAALPEIAPGLHLMDTPLPIARRALVIPALASGGFAEITKYQIYPMSQMSFDSVKAETRRRTLLSQFEAMRDQLRSAPTLPPDPQSPPEQAAPQALAS